MAYLNNPFKSIWQNEIFLNQYRQQAKPFSHLNLRMHWHPIFSPIFNEEVIDIFCNPGHEILTYNTWLMAAPEMWFSKDAWQYFSKEKLKSFAEAIEITEWSNDLLYVKLFDLTTHDYETKEVLDLQFRFREWSEMNKIEKQLEDICSTKSKSNDTIIETLTYFPTIEPRGTNSDN